MGSPEAHSEVTEAEPHVMKAASAGPALGRGQSCTSRWRRQERGHDRPQAFGAFTRRKPNRHRGEGQRSVGQNALNVNHVRDSKMTRGTGNLMRRTRSH